MFSQTIKLIPKVSSLMKANAMSTGKLSHLKTLAVTVPQTNVYHVEINRPDKLNTINDQLWSEFSQCFDELSDTSDCRAIVLSGAGRLFCAGIDLKSFGKLAGDLADVDDISRKAKILQKYIKKYQYSFTSMEKCHKPVIGAVHNACIGAAINMISSVDIRYCTKDAYFQVKETALGMTADVGVLQRLPKIIGSQSLVNELCFTARKMHADEAMQNGFVSSVFPDKDSMIKGAIDVAAQIAELSPVAVQGTKKMLLYSRDHAVDDALQAMADWNMYALQSEDFMNAVSAQLTKEKAQFSDL